MPRSMTLAFVGWLLGVALLAAPTAAVGGIEITGQVVDEGGRPLARAEVALEPLLSHYDLGLRLLTGEDPVPVVASARTGKDGGFRIAAPEAGMWRVVVRHPSHLEMACALRPVLEPLALATVSLPRRLERRARIVDDAGRPVPGARVTVQGWLRGPDYPPPCRWHSERRYATATDDGRVPIASAAGETLWLAALAGDRFGHQSFHPGDELTLRLREMVRARVVDDGGRPASELVAWVAVIVLSPIGVTGKQGELLVPDLPGQELKLLFDDEAGLVGRVSRTLAPEELAEPPVVLRLPPAVEVDGRVIDAVSRQPIAGAWVRMDDDARRSDRHGGFRLRVPRTGGWDELEVAAAGYLVERPDPSPRKLPGGELLVALEPALGIAGRVTDADGAAIVGAEVRAKPLPLRKGGLGRWWKLTHPICDVFTRSGADGGFRLQGLLPETGYELRVRRRGWAPRRVDVPGLDPAKLPEFVEIALTPGLEAFGRVANADGQPVTGASVSLAQAPSSAVVIRRFGKWPVYEAASAGTDGRFSFYDLPAGSFVLDVEAPGFAPRKVSGIEITAASVDLGTVVLDPGWKVSGRVIDVDGAGIAGAKVWVSASPPPVHVSAVTATDGSFTLEDLPRTTSVSVHVWAQGYMPKNSQQVSLEPDRPLEIVLDDESRVLRGQVVDADGDGVAAQVQLDTLRPGSVMPGTASGTDGDGHFRFAIEAGATVRIRAGNDEGFAVPVEVQISDEGEIPEVRVVLRSAAACLHGRLTDRGGRPVFDSRIDLDPLFESQIPYVDSGLGLDFVFTDAEGRFTIPGLEGGIYRLRAEHPDYQPLETRLELAAGIVGTIDLAFDEYRDHQRSKVSGRIVGDGGAGIDGAVVQLVKDDWGGQSFAETLSFGDGRFELTAAEAGTYSVMASFGDLATQRSEPFRVGDGAVEGVVLHLPAGAAVSGWILGLETEELAGVEVAAHAQAYGSRTGRTSSHGRFRVAGLAVGEWTVTASHASSGRSVSRQVVLVGPGDEVEVDFRFARGFRLSGHVSMDGAPLADGALAIRCSGGPLHARVGIHDGRFFHEGVPAGDCALITQDSGLGVRALPRRIEVDGDTEVTLELTTAVLTGRVASRSGRESVAGAVVSLRDKDGGTYTETGPDGRFEVVVESGRTWELQVFMTGFIESRSSVTIERPGIDVEIGLEPEEPTG